MQGCGNDYVLIYEEEEKCQVTNKSSFAQKVCNRHFGIGADGVLFVKKLESKVQETDRCLFLMEIYNEDGTKAQMCGNGIRCVAKYVFQKGYVADREFDIVCSTEKKRAQILMKQDVTYVRINMGKPDFQAKKIPVLSEKEFVINEKLLDQYDLKVTCVSMGNPHAVIMVDEIEKYNVEEIGRKLAYSPRFPEHTNVEFVKVLDKKAVEMRVWERGVGETLACGTGACAAMVVSCINGLTVREVTVKLLGGKLFCEWDKDDQNVYMTGPAQLVFEGNIDNY